MNSETVRRIPGGSGNANESVRPDFMGVLPLIQGLQIVGPAF
jgi:hypothetical protein